MINRELIRSKVVQICYSFAQNEGRNPKVAEQELSLSFSKAYEMYMLLLLLLTEVGRVAERMYDVRVKRAERLGEDTLHNPKFVQNRFMKQLECNSTLLSYRETLSDDFFNAEYERNLWSRIENSDYFNAYMTSGKSSYEEDRDIYRAIYRNEICNNENLDGMFEDLGLYWNDDKTIVDTFVLKTINKFTPDSTEEQELMPEFRYPEDREFATALLNHTLANVAYYDQLIADHTRNWELERVALMDRIIMRVALAEIICFPEIPVGVSINEYVELAKVYSTPKSWRYVNGTLDNISKKLLLQNKIVKSVK